MHRIAASILSADRRRLPDEGRRLAAAGVDDAVVGRALFGSDDWAATVAGLRVAMVAVHAAGVPA